MNEKLAGLGKLIDYQFRNQDLLQQALTHRSAGSPNYERLEFLGDGLLNFLIADALFRLDSESSEGDLTRLRASLVKESTLAAVAGELNLGACLRLGPGEQTSGGFRRKSILADALEALLGAVYLDGGFAAAQTVVARLFKQRLASLPAAEDLKDAKTRLQELLQSRGLDLPEYQLEDSSGADHQRVFTVSCKVPGRSEVVRASGSSRRKAEQAAAKLALVGLNNA